MAANKVFRVGPVALSNVTTTNILNTGAANGSVVGYTAMTDYVILRHIRIVNKTAGAVTFSLWIGATGANAAGTEFIGTGLPVAANSAFDWYGMVRLDSGDFLVGGANALTSLTLEAEGEIGKS